MNEEMTVVDPFVELEEERKKAVARGATGISIFARPGATPRQVAADAVAMLRMMNRENSMSIEEFERTHPGLL